MAVDSGRWIVQLEHEAGIVIDPAAERSGEFDAIHVDAPAGQRPDTAFEPLQRRPERDARLGRESA